MRLPPARLRNLSVALLEKRGVPADSARLQANLLLEAELRGLPSHGLQRLPLLLSRLDKGLANPTTRGNGTWRRASFLSVDGERGLGPVVMMDAMRVTRRILKETGLAIAAIRNANHMGMLAYYAEAAARDGLIGIVMSTSEALVHPFGGTQALIGTNPVAIGIPAAGHPFVLDLATSIVSMGKINNHAMRGLAIPARLGSGPRRSRDNRSARGTGRGDRALRRRQGIWFGPCDRASCRGACRIQPCA